MGEFNSVFADNMDAELDFDTMFSSDGDLIDKVCGFEEDGSCETDDFDELHQTDDDTCPDGIADELGTGHDTKNAPSGAEGTDSAPDIDLAYGESFEDEFSANGKKGESPADRMYDDYDKEVMSAKTGEGPDIKMDPENIEDEFDKITHEDATDDLGAGCDPGDSSYDDDEFADDINTSGSDYEDDGLTDGSLSENFGSENGTDDLDKFMSKIDEDEPDDAEGTHDDAYDDGDYDGHGTGDSDLIDLVAGDD